MCFPAFSLVPDGRVGRAPGPGCSGRSDTSYHAIAPSEPIQPPCGPWFRRPGFSFSPFCHLRGIFVICTGIVHLRDKTRHRLLRQLTDHSGFLAPGNCLFFLVSAVPNRPSLDLALFPEFDLLRKNWRVIRDEAMVQRTGSSSPEPMCTAEHHMKSFSPFMPV